MINSSPPFNLYNHDYVSLYVCKSSLGYLSGTVCYKCSSQASGNGKMINLSSLNILNQITKLLEGSSDIISVGLL